MIPVKAIGGFILDAWRHPKVRRAGWAALVLALADLLILSGFWLPAALAHHRLESAIAGIRGARLEAARARETSQAYSRLSLRAGELEAKWRKPATQADLMESLNRAAGRYGLRILSQDFNLKSLPGGGTDFEQTLSLSGAYPSLREFLGGLDNLPTLTLVRQARLERDGPAGGKVRATLLLSTYQKTRPGGA